MASFDNNHWYEITNGCYKAQDLSFAGSALLGETKGTRAVPFFQNTDLKQPEQQWQIYQYNDTYYTFRSKAAGPTAYLNAALDTDPNSTLSSKGRIAASITIAKLSDASMYWTVQPWADGTFKMQNAVNGSSWNLMVNGSSSFMHMDSNITAPQQCQEFSFTQLSPINDDKWSTIADPGRGVNDSPPTGLPTNIPRIGSDDGLSTGAKIGIGVGAGIGVLALILVGVFFFLRRRKATRTGAYEPWKTADAKVAPETGYAGASGEDYVPPSGQYERAEMPAESVPLQTSPGLKPYGYGQEAPVTELPGNTGPAELPVTEYQTAELPTHQSPVAYHDKPPTTQ